MNIYKKTIRGKDYIYLEDAQDGFAWPNFSGAPNRFNSTTKSFSVEIPEEYVDFFKDEHIHVGEYMPKNADDPQIQYRITVYINFDHPEWYPVKVILADADGSNAASLSEDQAHMIDDLWKQVGFSKIDLKVRKKPSSRNPGDYTLYLSDGYFYQNEEDEFDRRHKFNANSDSLSDAASSDDEEVPFE